MSIRPTRQWRKWVVAQARGRVPFFLFFQKRPSLLERQLPQPLPKTGTFVIDLGVITSMWNLQEQQLQ